MQQAVELAQGERFTRPAEQREADGAEFPTRQPLGLLVRGRQRLFVVDPSAAASSCAGAGGPQLIVRGSDVGEKGFAFGGEVDELLVEFVDAGAEGVLMREEAFVAVVDVALGADS
jgi:hypothetical protein